jgi:aminoglycoside phosphotransferase (APT) family kinase protein
MPGKRYARLAVMNRDEITADVAARLVAEQFPQWAHLPVVPAAHSGWDNATFRLGEELSVRLPSESGFAAQVEKEHRWLPVLATQLPLPIPLPVGQGLPSGGYPWPWSIYRWLDGQPATLVPIADPTEFAGDLARFLAALFAIDATAGPTAGEHSQNRGGPLTPWDEVARESIELLVDDLDAAAVTEVWEAALASAWEHAPVWVHGDLIGSNLLVADGKLCAVIDFGCSAVGDPACDLSAEWMHFDDESRDVFRRGLPPFDEATRARGRGWALWKALLTVAGEKKRPGHTEATMRRMGWGNHPRKVIDLLVADHRQAAR